MFRARGDEKSGARQEWVNFCEHANTVSKFTTHKSNRFNAFFFFLNGHVIQFLTHIVSRE